MCICQSKTYTNSRYLVKGDVINYVNHFPCGYCADCIRKKRSEWQLRAYYESKSTFEKGGFVLFDTLTYSDEHLKYYHDIWQPALYNCWDYPCFSREDVKNFFKRLRVNLDRSGYDVDKKLRYFLTCEYGTNPDATHRPHYHILFFVGFKIDPCEFSKFVSRSWTFGFTDGLRGFDCEDCPVKKYCSGRCLYKNRSYVESERLIKSDNVNCLRAARYVSKYLGKDLYLWKKQFRRIYISFTIHHSNWMDDYNLRLQFKRLKNQVLPFHLQSLGFGLSALEYEDKDYILKYNGIRMPVSSKNIIASIPLSHYFKYKLFFNHYKIGIGSARRVVWKPNQLYYETKMRSLDSSIEKLANNLFSFCDGIDFSTALAVAKYSLVYRGTIAPVGYADLSYKEFYRRKIERNNLENLYFVPNNRLYYVHNTPRDRCNFNASLDCSVGYRQHVSDKLVFSRYDVTQSWSLSQFAVGPDGYIRPYYQEYENILDEYDAKNAYLTAVHNSQMIEDDKRFERYKQLGLVKR